MPAWYPLRFRPILKRYLWGGRRLGTVLHKPIGREEDYAESWEVSDHPNGQSVIADGSLAGTSLSELIRECGAGLLGRHHPQARFPLLFKFLDCRRSSPCKCIPTTGRPRTGSAGPGQNGSLDRAGRGAGRGCLCGTETRPRSAAFEREVLPTERRSCVCISSSRASAIASSFRRARSRAGRRAVGRGDPAGERHHVSTVRLESGRAGRQGTLAAHRGIPSGDQLRCGTGRSGDAAIDRGAACRAVGRVRQVSPRSAYDHRSRRD